MLIYVCEEIVALFFSFSLVSFWTFCTLLALPCVYILLFVIRVSPLILVSMVLFAAERATSLIVHSHSCQARYSVCPIGKKGCLYGNMKATVYGKMVERATSPEVWQTPLVPWERAASRVVCSYYSKYIYIYIYWMVVIRCFKKNWSKPSLVCNLS